MRRIFPLAGVVLGMAAGLSAKVEIAKLKITAGDLKAPVVVTDAAVLKSFRIWSGPGNFKIENGVRTPIVEDGSIVWSAGAAVEPAKDLPLYEVSFLASGPEEPVVYTFRYRHDPAGKKGYLYLPGKGEKGYDTNVRTIYRGVEGNWYRASDEFVKTVGGLIRGAK